MRGLAQPPGMGKVNKCGIVMTSNGNINRGIQLIIDVIDYKC